MDSSSPSASAPRRPSRRQTPNPHPPHDPQPVRDATMTDRILILDFGSQVTQLIARRVRESGVYCEILPFNTSAERIAEFAPAAIILSGGPASVNEAAAPRAPQTIFEMGVPVLGICYGQQAMCVQQGGKLAASDHLEFGRAFIEVTDDCALLADLWPRGSKEQV